jgi:hypothetical protein
VPPQVGEGLDAVLDRSANELNRASKRLKFGSMRSEDAVTWTVFRGLAEIEALDAAVTAAGLPPAAGEPSLLLWGAPAHGPDAGMLAEDLAEVSRALREYPRRRSEPDVVLRWKDVLLVIEVKRYSGNEHKESGYGGWSRYVADSSAFAVPSRAVRDLGLYELTRNWVIGRRLAQLGARRFALINLAPPALGDECEQFHGCLRTDEQQQFVHVTWQQLLGATELPDWLANYASEVELIAA